MNTVTKDIEIEGMACSGCSDAVSEALENLNNVENASADYESGNATVTFDADSVSADDLEAAVDGAGYEFLGMKN